MKEHAATLYLAVPTPAVSDETTPALETKLVTAVLLPIQPKPKIPSSFPDAAVAEFAGMIGNIKPHSSDMG